MKNKNLIENGECATTGSMLMTNDAKDLKVTTKEKISGIYKIINKVNNKYYVGSSDDIERRWNNHILKFNKNKHYNKHLQAAWNKYGKDNFNFLVIEYIFGKSNLLEKEQYYLNKCKNDPSNNYNISYDASAPMSGRKHSSETIQKMSKSQSGENNPMFGKVGANSGKAASKETKRKMRENNSKYWKGKRFSQETRTKMSNSHKRNPRIWKHTSESKERLSLNKRDKTIFSFKNIKTGEIFIGTTFNHSIKFGLPKYSMRELINGRHKTFKSWIMI